VTDRRQGLLDFAAVTESPRPYYFVKEGFLAGDWHVCHHTAGGGVASDCWGRSEVLARDECRRMNWEHAQEAARLARAQEFERLAPGDRPVPRGFYTDRDAS
jgi:hypothetical protein